MESTLLLAIVVPTLLGSIRRFQREVVLTIVTLLLVDKGMRLLKCQPGVMVNTDHVGPRLVVVDPITREPVSIDLMLALDAL